MIIRQLKAKKFESFNRQLIQHAQNSPMDASYTVSVTANGAEYLLKIQPEGLSGSAI